MSFFPPDDDDQGDSGAPVDEQELGSAPTMLYMKPVAEAESAKEATEKAAELDGGETLLMMPAVPGATPADEGDAPPEQGPAAGPLPEGEGLAELDSAKTMMYMPAVDAADAPGGGSDEVQKKLAQLKESLGEAGADVDGGASTVAYMPAVGTLPMEQAMDRMMAETGEAPVMKPAEPASPEKPRVATEPAFPAVSPTPVVKPGPDLDDLDDDDLAALSGKRKGGKIFLILFLLILLGAGGVTVAMLFDWMVRPEFLDFLPHYELNF